MQFNTKLNVGDTIWYISSSDSSIKEIKITKVAIQYTPNVNGVYNTDIVYGTNDCSAIYESGEGKSWWRTRAEIIRHLLRSTEPKPEESHCFPHEDLNDECLCCGCMYGQHEDWCGGFVTLKPVLPKSWLSKPLKTDVKPYPRPTISMKKVLEEQEKKDDAYWKSFDNKPEPTLDQLFKELFGD